VISIITAVHNEIEFNKLFLYSLRKNTSLDYEVIIVDNHSTDGSAEYFESEGCTVIRNDVNHCYPESQNIGMRYAKGDFFIFLNNDVYLGTNWDINLIKAMQENNLDIASLDSFQTFEDPRERRKFHHRWRHIRKKTKFLYADKNELTEMINKLYQQDFDIWCDKRHEKTYPHIFPGINGSAVATTRKLWDKIGPQWDEQVEAADWDLHIRVKKYIETHHDIQPPMIIPWALHHHFAGVTFRKNPEPRQCQHTHLALESKWTQDEINNCGPHLPTSNLLIDRLRSYIKRIGKILTGKHNNKITGH